MRLMTIRVINNFGLDFKQFVFQEEVLDMLVEIIEKDSYCKVERRDAIMTLKNLNFEASPAERAEIEKKVTFEFLIKVMRTRPTLRDQALLFIKMKFQKIELLSSNSKQCATQLAESFSFLSTTEKVDEFFSLLTYVFNEAHS